MATTTQSKPWTGYNPSSLSQFLSPKISRSPPAAHYHLSDKAPTSRIERYARSQPNGNDYEDLIKPVEIKGFSLEVSDYGKLFTAPLGDTVGDIHDQRSYQKRAASDNDLSSAKYPRASSFQDNKSDTPVPDLFDTIEKWEASSDPMENDDQGTSATSSPATTPAANTNLEGAGPTDFDTPKDKSERCDNIRDLQKDAGREKEEDNTFLRPKSNSPVPRIDSTASAHSDRSAPAGKIHDEKALFPSIKSIKDDIETSSATRAPHLEDSDDEGIAPAHPDPLVDSLASRMKGNLIVRDVAVQASIMVSVPKGFVMTEQITAEAHYDSQAWATRQAKKRKRDDGTPQDEQFGFRADEINSSGAISVPHCRPSNLSNQIHPLLRRDRFDDTPDEIYDELLPALRLASMCLTQPACMPFWVTLALGEREHDWYMSKKYRIYCRRIASSVPLNEENIAKTKEELEALGRANVIHFAFRHRTAMPATNAWGCSAPIPNYQKEEEKNLARSVISLHGDFYTTAERLSKLMYRETSQGLRFSFYLAVLILHELAHSIEGAYHRLQRDPGRALHIHPQRMLEPFFFGHQGYPELGRYLERMMFGGEVQPINKRADGSHGLCTTDWPHRPVPFDPENRLYYTIPMDYIQSMFLMETWLTKGQSYCYKTFHIPRTGATATYINSFTTMDWLESDNAVEALALTKAQPACKKRLMATGEGEDQRLEEEKATSLLLGKLESARMEEASRRFQESPSSRRHSFHATDAEEISEPPKKELRRSRSFTAAMDQAKFSPEEREVIANELRSSFKALCEKIPAHDPQNPVGDTPTSEIVKVLRNRAIRNARPGHWDRTRSIVQSSRAKTP